MLVLTDITKRYDTPRGPVEVLSHASLTLASGEAAAIMGPSGSGKSTLLYMLGALEPPTSGSITLDGQNPFELAEPQLARFRNRSVGFVFQDHLLLPQCSVLENVLTPTLVDGERDAAADRLRAVALLASVGLSHRLEHHPGELSGGERQRAALARALIRKPRLLLCDEPTGNLDRSTAADVAALLVDLHRREDVLLIVVTHSAQLAECLPTRYEIHDGRLAPA